MVLKCLFKKKLVIIFLIIISFVSWVKYRINQTEQGICHSEGKVLSQEELEQRFYQNVLLDYRHTDLYFKYFRHETNRAYHQFWAKYGFHGRPAGHITLTKGEFSLPYIKKVIMARALQEPDWRVLDAKKLLPEPKEPTKKMWQQQAKAYQQWRIDFAIEADDLDINAKTQTISTESRQRYVKAIQKKQAIVYYSLTAGHTCVQYLTFIQPTTIQKATPTLPITWLDKVMGYGKHQRQIDVYEIPIGCPYNPDWRDYYDFRNGADGFVMAEAAERAIPAIEEMIKQSQKYRDMVSVSTCGAIKDEHKISSYID